MKMFKKKSFKNLKELKYENFSNDFWCTVLIFFSKM